MNWRKTVEIGKHLLNLEEEARSVKWIITEAEYEACTWSKHLISRSNQVSQTPKERKKNLKDFINFEFRNIKLNYIYKVKHL